MTSNIIADTFWINQIDIEPRVWESLLVGSFGDHNPLPTLSIRNTEISEFSIVESRVKAQIDKDKKKFDEEHKS